MSSLRLVVSLAVLTILSGAVVQVSDVRAADVEVIDGCEFACGEIVCGGECGNPCDVGCAGESPFARWVNRDPWKLPQPCAFERLGINTGGWMQAGITFNGDTPADYTNGPMLTNDRSGEPQLNQLWLYFQRPIDTKGCGLDIGGRVDLLYGTDWRAAYFHGLGFEDRINGPDSLYGLSIAQMYAEVGINNLSIKMGRMTGILGYEIVPPMGNFFYSHSYALAYGEPVLITGLMGKYTLSKQLTALAGFHQGVHRFEDNNDQLNFQGGLTWERCDKLISLAYALDAGRNEFLPGQGDEYIQSLVLKLQLTERLLYVLQSDLGYINNSGAGADAEWYGINQNLFYTLNKNWSAGLRFEWFRDDDGAKVLGLGNLPDARGWNGAPGYAGSFSALSLGLNWKPKSNVTFRPEVRWDWYDGLANAAGPYPLPFDAGASNDQFTAAADLIVTF